MKSKRGRPSKTEQIEIQKKIRPYFDSNLSARFTSQLPEMPNEKTIQKYFNQWTHELSKNLVSTFKQRRLDVIGKSLLIFDSHIYNLSVLVNDMMESHRDSKQHYEDKKQKSLFLGNTEPEPFKLDLKLIKTINQLTQTVVELKDHKICMEIQQFSIMTEAQIEAEIKDDLDELLEYRSVINRKIEKMEWVKYPKRYLRNESAMVVES